MIRGLLTAIFDCVELIILAKLQKVHDVDGKMNVLRVILLIAPVLIAPLQVLASVPIFKI